MRFLPLLTLVFALHVPAFGMGSKPAGRMASDAHTQIQVAGDLTESEQRLLLDDFAYLEQQNIEDNSAINALFHLDHTSASGMLSWLAERMQFIVANQKDSPSSRTESSVVMSNLGASLYFRAKQANSPGSFQVANGPLLSVNSPRVGIIEAGSGLFRGPFANENVNTSAPSSRIYRLGTIFHEARHSDGNGISLAFFHEKCPAGHIYENQAACDHNLNGPYTIGGNTILAMEKSCQNCSEQEREILRLSALDSFSRIIRDSVETMQADECSYVNTISSNELVPPIISEKCRANSRQTSPVSESPSVFWDEKPESLNHS